MLLLIDTTTELASVCLSSNGEVLAEIEDNTQKNHAAFLQPAIKLLLQQQNMELQDLHAISVMSGPGSYTGLRVGMASAKGLCYSLDLPLITINTLKAMAASVKYPAILENDNVKTLICPMIDARRMEVFTALFDINLNALEPPQAMILDDKTFAEYIENTSFMLTGNGVEKFTTMFKHRNIVVRTLNNYNSGFAQLSSQHWLTRDFADLAYSEPEYLKGVYIQKK